MTLKVKRQGKLMKGVLLLHDNTPASKLMNFKRCITEGAFVEIDRPPYSPDLTVSDNFFVSKS